MMEAQALSSTFSAEREKISHSCARGIIPHMCGCLGPTASPPWKLGSQLLYLSCPEPSRFLHLQRSLLTSPAQPRPLLECGCPHIRDSQTSSGDLSVGAAMSLPGTSRCTETQTAYSLGPCLSQCSLVGVGLMKERFPGPTVCLVALPVPNFPAQCFPTHRTQSLVPCPACPVAQVPSEGTALLSPLACLFLALLIAPMQTEARGFLLCGIHVTVANFVTNPIPKIQHNYFYSVVFEVKNSNERLIALSRSVDKMALDRCAFPDLHKASHHA